MFLQDDKPTISMSRERANRILYNAAEMPQSARTTATATAVADRTETFTNFNYNHNLTKYNELVQTKYPETLKTFENISNLSALSVPETALAATVETKFDKYYTPNDNTFVAPAEPAQKYYNNENPIPYQSFKPKIIADFEDIQDTAAASAVTDEAFLEKVDEVQVVENTAPVTEVERASSTAATEAHLKLNSKGLIACVAFIAITALVVLLVILNSIAIGNGGARIDSLRAENTELAQEYNRLLNEREAAYNEGVAAAGDMAGVEPEYVSIPPISSYDLAPANPDYSTNIFDQICKFFSKLFGA